MSFPQSLNTATPTGSVSPKGGAAQLRDLKQLIADVFGIPTDPTSLTAAAFSMTSAGAVTVVNSLLTTQGIVPTLGTITDDRPILNGTVTWNDASETFNAIKVNVTDTASASASRLLALQVGGTDKFVIRKDGAITTGSWNGTAVAALYGGTGIDSSASTGVPKVNSGTWSIQALTNGQLLVGSTSAVPVAATLTAANNIVITNGAGSITVGSRERKVTKTAADTISLDDTLSDDDELLYAMTAGQKFIVDAYLLVTAANATMDLKLGWTFPTDCTIDWGLFDENTVLSDEGDSLAVQLASGLNGIHVRAYVDNPNNAGNLVLQWAQNTSNGSNLTLEAGSTMKLLLIS